MKIITPIEDGCMKIVACATPKVHRKKRHKNVLWVCPECSKVYIYNSWDETSLDYGWIWREVTPERYKTIFGKVSDRYMLQEIAGLDE